MIFPAIHALGLTKSYGHAGRTNVAIQDLDVTVASGEVLAVTGPSGVGKTTLINILAGWIEPDEGTLVWSDEHARGNGTAGTGGAPGWDRLAVVPQGLALADELTVAENITLSFRISKSPTPWSRLDSLITSLGLLALLDRLTNEISVGERQRVMIARALSTKPAILLADEPTAHQDDNNAKVIHHLFKLATEEGAACVIATRQPSMAMADRHLKLPDRPG